MQIGSELLEKIKNGSTGKVLNLSEQYPPLTASFIKSLVKALKEHKNTVIQTLILSNNQIGDEGLKYLSTLDSITSLTLSSNQVTDEGIKYISAAKNLKYLDITDNIVTDKSVQFLQPLPLEVLDIDSANLTAEGKTSLINSGILYLKLSDQIIDKSSESINSPQQKKGDPNLELYPNIVKQTQELKALLDSLPVEQRENIKNRVIRELESNTASSFPSPYSPKLFG